MANSTKSPGTVTNTESLSGSKDWFEPDNAKIDDSVYTFNSPSEGLQGFYISSYLDCTNFQLEIPAGATIDGISVSIKRYRDGIGPGNDVLDHEIFLLNGSSTIGNDKSAGASWSTSVETVTFGGPTDLWGATLNPSTVNGSGFGVRIACQGIAGDIDGYGGGGAEEAYLDHVEMTVFYTGSNIKFGTTGIPKIFFVVLVDKSLNSVAIRKVKFGDTDIF